MKFFDILASRQLCTYYIRKYFYNLHQGTHGGRRNYRYELEEEWEIMKDVFEHLLEKLRSRSNEKMNLDYLVEYCDNRGWVLKYFIIVGSK